jgi:hypothetical protein
MVAGCPILAASLFLRLGWDTAWMLGTGSDIQNPLKNTCENKRRQARNVSFRWAYLQLRLLSAAKNEAPAKILSRFAARKACL